MSYSYCTTTVHMHCRAVRKTKVVARLPTVTHLYLCCVSSLGPCSSPSTTLSPICVLGDCSSGTIQWGPLPSSSQLVLTGEHQQIRWREEGKVWIFIPLALILWGSSEAGYLSSVKVKAPMRSLYSYVCFFVRIQTTDPPFWNLQA